jgi:hypothetical protein
MAITMLRVSIVAAFGGSKSIVLIHPQEAPIPAFQDMTLQTFFVSLHKDFSGSTVIYICDEGFSFEQV